MAATVWDKLGIANIALNKLNKGSVDSLTNSGEFSDSLNRGIDLLMPSELSKNSWRFATKVQLLNVVVGTPILSEEWLYILEIPADYLTCLRLIPNVDYQIYENQIFCNSNVVKMEYRFMPAYTAMPSYFIDYFSTRLAFWFAKTVANNAKLAADLKADMTEDLHMATFVDSAAHPNRSIQSSPMLEVRGGGVNYYDRPPQV